MREDKKCPKCDSLNVYVGAQLNDHVEHFMPQQASVRAFENPGALFFKGARDAHVVADVCCDCGFIEFYASNPDVFKMLLGQ